MLKDDPDFQKNPLSQMSWFGGHPAVPRSAGRTWSPPTRADGTPLTHVAQVDLATEADNQGADLFASTGP